jgi:hypothetical protein
VVFRWESQAAAQELRPPTNVASNVRIQTLFYVVPSPMKILTLAIIPAAVLLAGCSSPIKVDPASLIGKTFPTVQGETLEEQPRTLPTDLAGKPVLLFVGYKQMSQFDIDRWMVGILQLKTPIEFYEVPTIAGMLPGIFANQIDDGMRGGIPKELWAGVITVYGDAGRIEAFTGTENPMPARVILLDATGKVLWFHDRGFSPALLQELDAKIRGL